MRRVLEAAGVVILATIVQLGVAPWLAVLGVKPDFLLLGVIGFALNRGTLGGSLLGAAAGLVEDIVVAQYLGVRALAFALAGLVTAQVRARMFGDQPLVPVVAALGGTVLVELVSWAVWSMLGLPLPLGTSLVRVIIPAGLYNALLAPVLLGRWVVGGPWRHEVRPGA